MKFGYLGNSSDTQIGEYKENKHTFEDVGKLALAYYKQNPKIVLIGRLVQAGVYLRLGYLYEIQNANDIIGYRLLSEEFSQTILKEIQ